MSYSDASFLNFRIGCGLGLCLLPGAASPGFTLGEDEMEMGIHGEPGIWRDKLKPADEIVDEILDRIFADARSLRQR